MSSIKEIIQRFAVPVKETHDDISPQLGPKTFATDYTYHPEVLEELRDTERMKIHITNNPRKGYYWIDITGLYCVCQLIKAYSGSRSQIYQVIQNQWNKKEKKQVCPQQLRFDGGETYRSPTYIPRPHTEMIPDLFFCKQYPVLFEAIAILEAMFEIDVATHMADQTIFQETMKRVFNQGSVTHSGCGYCTFSNQYKQTIRYPIFHYCMWKQMNRVDAEEEEEDLLGEGMDVGANATESYLQLQKEVERLTEVIRVKDEVIESFVD